MSTSNNRRNRRKAGTEKTKKASAGTSPVARDTGVEPRVCGVEACGRPAYVRGLCQTHHRQMLETGETWPIRPYRPRSPGTVKFSGLRLSPRCAEHIQLYAERHGVSHGAAIAFILEEWTLKR